MAVFTISKYNHGNTLSQERHVQVLKTPPPLWTNLWYLRCWSLQTQSLQGYGVRVYEALAAYKE
jgi:hypothetical protein